MKEKVKNIFKNRIFIFVLGGLLFSSISVYAVTYFPSNQVTYDNGESGLESTDVQGAIDELYNTCSSSILKTSEDLKKNTVTTGDGLYKDEYEDGRYIFKGANPNNYITFNDVKSGWRIISIELDNTIKIVKDTSSGTIEWNSSCQDSWSNSTIQVYLAGTFYKSLTTTAKNQIERHSWSIGTVTWNNNNLSTQISNENSKTWNGKVGLLTASEYLRANSNKDQCQTMSLARKNAATCKNTNWLTSGSSWTALGFWGITPATGIPGNNYDDAVLLEINGSVGAGDVCSYGSYNGLRQIRPVVYLSSSAVLNGKGTKTDPYTIE